MRLPYLLFLGFAAAGPACAFDSNSGPETSEPLAKEQKQIHSAKPARTALIPQALDDLFKRLATAKDPDEAKGVATAIEHLWLHSGSDTASLLMSRASAAMEAKNSGLALTLLDSIVDLYPKWAAAWNERAMARYASGDTDGAMSDINHLLTLEPRHFHALNGLAMIFQRNGFNKQALEVFKKSLAVYPLQEDVEKQIESLSLEVNGRDI